MVNIRTLNNKRNALKLFYEALLIKQRLLSHKNKGDKDEKKQISFAIIVEYLSVGLKHYQLISSGLFI